MNLFNIENTEEAIFFKEFQSREGIEGLGFDDFKEKMSHLWVTNFFVFRNIDRSLRNKMGINEQNFPTFKEKLAELCFGSGPIEDRFNTFSSNVRGMGDAFISEFLYLSNAEKFSIYNSKTKKVYQWLGINLANKTTYDRFNHGHIYQEFLSMKNEILDYVKIKNEHIDNSDKLDALFYLVGVPKEDHEEYGLQNEQDGSFGNTRIYVVKMGRSATDCKKIKEHWTQESIACFGFPSIAGYNPSDKGEYDYHYLKSFMIKHGKPLGKIRKIASYVKNFHQARPNRDWALAYHNQHIHGFGQVKSEYHLNKKWSGDEHAIGVDWTWLEHPVYLPDYSKELYRSSKTPGTVSKITAPVAIKDFFDLVKNYKANQSKNSFDEIDEEIENKTGEMSLEDVVDKVFIPEERLSDIESALLDRKQVIFDGVPGTGKTFVAKELAQYFSEKEGYTIGKVELVSCHGGITFEQLFQGLAPKKSGGLQAHKGSVTKLAERAAENEDAYYVLILDEINRANIPQVFGQMLYLLEYRGEEVELPFEEESVNLPENLLIIATMNSEDRSVGRLDFAFRRRFSHFKFDPDARVLKDYLHENFKSKNSLLNIPKVISIFKNLNTKLKEHDENFQIGQSYFMTDYPLDDIGLERLWETDIIPLLEEKFFHNKSIVKTEFHLANFLQPAEEDSEMAA